MRFYNQKKGLNMIKGIVNISSNKIVAWTVYPLIIALGFALHYLLVSADYGIQLSTYMPVISCSLIITLLEYKFPFVMRYVEPIPKEISN